MRSMRGLLAGAVVMAFAVPARADITWDWQENGTGNLHVNSKAFSDVTGHYTLTATAYENITFNNNQTMITSASAANDSANDLYVKSGGGSGFNSETGLGLNSSDGSGDHEITYGNGILLNFTGYSQPYFISIGSVQSSSDDVAAVYAFNTTTGKGTLVGEISGNASNVTVEVNGSSSTTFMVTELAQPYGPWWDRTYPNVLLTTTIVSSVPEPSTMALVALGAAGFIGYGLRRRGARRP